MSLESLFDVPGFSALRSLVSNLNVELTVHGGFVRRLVLGMRDEDRLEQLEEMSFFSSDIDVIHSGDRILTNTIHKALIGSIPFGECIRWQVRSSEESADYLAAMPMNGVVPANLLTLSTAGGWGIKDEWAGRDDIERATYRYIRNGFYKRSPLYRAGRDLEIFSALLFIKAVVEDPHVNLQELDEQPGWGDVKTVIHAACSSPAMLMSLQESSYLRARFLYLIKDICTLAPDEASFQLISKAFDLQRLVTYLNSDPNFGLGWHVESLFTKESGAAISISARLGGDQYRMDHLGPEWWTGEGSLQTKSMAIVRGERVVPSLPLRHVVLTSSPDMKINRGVSVSSRSDEVVNEFLHFAVPQSRSEYRDLEQYANDDLACLLELSSSPVDSKKASDFEERPSILVPLPTVCSRKPGRDGGLLYVRINALGYLENAPSLLNAPADHAISARLSVIVEPYEELRNEAPTVHLEVNNSSEQSAADASTASNDRFRMSKLEPVSQHVVFVHGILSNAQDCFGEMLSSFNEDSRFAGAKFSLFDYDYNNAMEESAGDLDAFLTQLTGNLPITLICHSMGGLVGRLAVLRGHNKIRRVVMLCTPNFGALRTAQLGMLAQLTMLAFGKIYGLFRKPGIRDLTRVTEVFKSALQSGRQHADDVEYVTIPGEYFHEARSFFSLGSQAGGGASTGLFGALNAISALSAINPLWSLGLIKPHDGIVEAASNNLIPCGAGRHSEKCPAINNPEQFGSTYAHVAHSQCSELTHVTTQHDATIISLVKDIVASDTITRWYETLPRDLRRDIRVQFSA